jgi:ATP-binding cassette subfamily G (WHITE) protein 2 (SNQ2)
MAEIPALYSQRPIVERHRKGALYHPFIEAVALTFVDLVPSFLTLVIFSVILYFLVGLQTSAAQFFIFFLFVLSLSLTLKSFFRFLAASFPTPAGAQSVAGVSTLILALYTGYSIPKPSMIGALRWITYINVRPTFLFL